MPEAKSDCAPPAARREGADPLARLPPLPTREQIADLPPFAALGIDRVTVVTTAEQAAHAVSDLLAQRAVGFDTEAKPTFVKGEVSQGPHVVQFSTLQHAYLFQMHRTALLPALSTVLASTATAKVGFGLGADNRQLLAKLGTRPNAALDLNTLFRQRGYRKSMGVRTAIAIVFAQRFAKSKRLSTSNWSHAALTSSQVLYAANDAYAAIAVFAAMGAPEEALIDFAAPPTQPFAGIGIP